MLVLWVFPFRSYALFEEVVVGFECEFGGRSYVVLIVRDISEDAPCMSERTANSCGETYVDAPKFFYGVEGDNFFEEIVPIVALENAQSPSLSQSHGVQE